MEKVILFLCDICGTLNGNLDNTLEDYLKLNDVLNSISEKNDNCKILFAIVSTEKETVVRQYLKELSQHLNNNIYFSKQFYDNGYILEDKSFHFISGKCYQIIEYLKELNQNLDLIKIYYADDSKFFQTYINEYFKFKNINIPLEPIIPREKLGLKELNKLLNEEINLSNKRHH